MIKKRRLYLAATTVWLLVALGYSAGENAAGSGAMELPPAREIPGITTADKFPRGCVDCHINMPEIGQDERISTLMAKWNERVESGLLEKAQAVAPAGVTLKGVHPEANASLADIPTACISCHRKMPKAAPPLGLLVHRVHLVGGGSNHFLTIFQGECTHCHKMDPQSGAWSMPSGPEK